MTPETNRMLLPVDSVPGDIADMCAKRGNAVSFVRLASYFPSICRKANLRR
jgi:hypothetical protein